jgi:exo-beta-1,3-glucanase (GH17 family)
MSKFAREKIVKGNKLIMPPGNAICYSGYREGQSPQTGDYPSYDEILEDLRLLSGDWQYLRLYDCSQHALSVLDVIRDNKLDFKVMVGVDLGAEMSNPNCPWGGDYANDVLQQNREINERDMKTMIEVANNYSDIVFAASIGNEASVDWNDHMVPVERLVEYATLIKSNIAQPITFCENYVPWHDKLLPLVEVLDFISIHTYPVWEYQTIESALSYTEQNYQSVAHVHPNKPIVITEAGWTTNSNGRGIEPWNATVQLQAEYCTQLHHWSSQANILTFMFEAFDEPWKGSSDELEPEKHWGFFDVNRSPKLVMQRLFAA